jgi:anaphase-promoting complex subunit 5
VQGNCLDDSEQWSQHTVQSIVWSAAGMTCNSGYQASADTDIGCEKLAVIEENIVTAFNEVGGDSNDVITVTLNRAYRVRVISPHQGIP